MLIRLVLGWTRRIMQKVSWEVLQKREESLQKSRKKLQTLYRKLF